MVSFFFGVRGLIPLFGEGMGAGIAVQFYTMGGLGIILCLAYVKRSDDPLT